MMTAKSSLAIDKNFIQKTLTENLVAPATELSNRPKKEVRSQLVLIGYELAHTFAELDLNTDDSSNLSVLMQIIEEIHTGSLIVDDIQDNSTVRRKGPCVHLQYGVPIALNAGNWLYFKALQSIDSLHLDSTQKLQLYQSFHRVLADAHRGQAIDLGTDIVRVPPHHIEEICMLSLEYKSGCLAGLAMASGAIIANASEDIQAKIYAIGKQLGILLQMFDDLGNLNTCTVNPKSLEDLYLRRPSFVWAYLFSQCSTEVCDSFIKAIVCLPDREPLHSLLRQTKLKEHMSRHAHNQMQIFKKDLLSFCGTEEAPPALKKIFQLGDQLYAAYN